MPTERQLRQENHQRRKIADYFVPGNKERHRYRALDDSGTGELLDDWMTAGPAADLTPSN